MYNVWAYGAGITLICVGMGFLWCLMAVCLEYEHRHDGSGDAKFYARMVFATLFL